MGTSANQPQYKKLETQAPANEGPKFFGRMSCQSCIWRMALTNTCQNPVSSYFGKTVTSAISCVWHFPGKRLNSMSLIKPSSK